MPEIGPDQFKTWSEDERKMVNLWIVEHDINPVECFWLDLQNSFCTFYTYKLDERGQRYRLQGTNIVAYNTQTIAIRRPFPLGV